MSREAVDQLKRRIPLLEYLQAHDWRPLRRLSGGRWMGLCPLHDDRRPSLIVDPDKGLFYCYGCERGGDVIRFAEVYYQVRFSQALVLLRRWRGEGSVLDEAADFYRTRLRRIAVPQLCVIREPTVTVGLFVAVQVPVDAEAYVRPRERVQ